MNRYTAYRQRGFSIIAAIFLIVVLAALSVYLVTISSVQHQTSLLALQGARALAAARAGVEWGAYDTLINGNCAGTTLNPGGALAGFQVNVACATTSHTEQGQNIDVYRLTAVAEFPAGGYGQLGYVQRQLTATVSDAPP